MRVTTHGEFQFCLLYLFIFTVGGAGSSCKMLEDKTDPALHFVLGFCYPQWDSFIAPIVFWMCNGESTCVPFAMSRQMPWARLLCHEF